LKVINVVGARPNLMKIAPIVEAMNLQPTFEQVLVHTGQHYDAKMSQIFFDDLGIPEPDIYLNVGSGTHAEQTARVMVSFEKVLLEKLPNVVVVVGDVNSTMACAITAAKLRIPVAHVEAGLRSFDREMPEEINRIVTDNLSDLLFTTSSDANENLRKEGISEDKIFFVGNVMIDTLKKHQKSACLLQTAKIFGLEPGQYALLTLHRPSNVDDPSDLSGIMRAILKIADRIPILFPAHPRTIKRLVEFGLKSMVDNNSGLILTKPLGYLQFLDLMMNARMVLTDSGGIQEETTILNVPCLTIRENTERPVTITEGTNVLAGTDPDRIVSLAESILNGTGKKGNIPELWDGKAAGRIVEILSQKLGV
jgi:UDP-N-acetylglucosamine 2-epimerase (non-hydrolysing)